MLNSDKKTYYDLTVRFNDESRYFLKATLFNSSNTIMKAREEHHFGSSYHVPKGMYTLRIEMNGEINDELIILDKNMDYEVGNRGRADDEYTITPPRQFSSALLDDYYPSSHNYYSVAARESSRSNTVRQPEEIGGQNCSLFIFLRFASKEKYQDYKHTYDGSFCSAFRLTDEFGQVIQSFEDKNSVEINKEQGWAAYNSNLPAGNYYLIYKGKESRQIPLYVFNNWHTQVFMTMADKPVFGSTRIFLSKYREFNPHDHTYKYIDILLDKLQNKDYELNDELIRMAAYGKYESPMLGLICAYIYMLGKSTKQDDLFDTITRNMNNVILKDNIDSPDLRALNILAARRFRNHKFRTTPVTGTPMLRVGFEAILSAAVKNNELIAENSINDLITENLCFDSPFNTFRTIRSFIQPDSPKHDNPFNISEKKLFTFNQLIKLDNIYHFDDLPKKKNNFSADITEILGSDTMKYIQANKKHLVEENWITNSILDLMQEKTLKNKSLSINEISSELNISGSTVNRIFTEWKHDSKKGNTDF